MEGTPNPDASIHTGPTPSPALAPVLTLPPPRDGEDSKNGEERESELWTEPMIGVVLLCCRLLCGEPFRPPALALLDTGCDDSEGEAGRGICSAILPIGLEARGTSLSTLNSRERTDRGSVVDIGIDSVRRGDDMECDTAAGLLNEGDTPVGGIGEPSVGRGGRFDGG